MFDRKATPHFHFVKIYQRIYAVLLFILCTSPCSVSAFLGRIQHPSKTPLPVSSIENDAPSMLDGVGSRRIRPFRKNTKFVLSAALKNPIIPKTASDELLSTLLATESKHSSQRDLSANERNRVNELIQQLTSYRVSFDPLQCIDGPFYATVYTSGGSKPPLWETLSELIPVSFFPEKRKNRKGQRYTILDRGDATRPASGDVVNYAEIFGEAFNLKAYGNFTKATEKRYGSYETMGTTTLLDKIRSSLSFLETIVSKQNQLTCPVNYDVLVTKAAISCLGTSFEIPISGTGCARVLYADESLRIFISPIDTVDGASKTQWETTGLIVVQIRIDLIDDTFGI